VFGLDVVRQAGRGEHPVDVAEVLAVVRGGVGVGAVAGEDADRDGERHDGLTG
jgi:hypothetical protein